MSAPVLAVLASGGGRSFANLADEVEAGRLEVELGLLLADRPDAGALERARERGVPTAVVSYREHRDVDELSRLVFEEVEAHGCTLVVLAGFLRLLKLPERWHGRVINIHPSLLPAFGGRGFYGMRVHEAVIASGARESGCTVHYVDDRYDAGPILLQRRVPVRQDDTPETLAARVFEEERIALPEAIRRHHARSR